VKTRFPVTRLIGFAIVIITIAVAGIGFFVVRRDIDRMRDAGRENLLWSTVQVEIELMRLQRSLAEFNAADTQSTPRAVNDRFDILWSRLSVFDQGTVGTRLAVYDTSAQTISRLFAQIKRLEPQVVGLNTADRASVVNIQRALGAFEADLRRLSRSVLHGEETISAGLREDLSRSSNALSIISAIAVLASMLMIYVFARETNRLRVLSDQNAALLKIANRTNEAKSEFLAMMSHELRTPMNGVLGLLALVRQQGLSTQQVRLLAQAERSGQQMIGLLGDILDFSALQDGKLDLDCKPFEPRNLALAVQEMFRPVATREGIEFTTTVAANCPERVTGDFARLRQALNHLATYVLETAGTRNIVLALDYRAGELVAAISFDYSQEGGEWAPDLIMGNEIRATDSFATEALGPMVSRGLINRMGGTTRLANPGGNRIAVEVSVPAREMIVDQTVIRVCCQSAALEAICKAALRGSRIKFAEPGQPTPPHVVISEAGGDREAALVQQQRAFAPQAILVALGRPQNPDAFDDMVEVPIDIKTIRAAWFMNLASGGTTLAETKDSRYQGNGNTT
jgi:signal transduction histidine kinase